MRPEASSHFTLRNENGGMADAQDGDYFLCSCYFSRNIFLPEYKLHVSFTSPDQFRKEYRQVSDVSTVTSSLRYGAYKLIRLRGLRISFIHNMSFIMYDQVCLAGVFRCNVECSD